VQRAEHQVPGFRRCHGQADGFQIAHFAHQDGVRVFAQRRTQSGGERERHRTDFALVHQAFLGLVHELDRVLDGQHVAVFALVQVVHHGSERGRLTRARRARHQHQPARLERELGKNLGRVELLQCEDLAGNRPKHGSGAAVLVEGVDPETGQTFNFEREIDLQEFFVALALRVAHDVVHHGVNRFVVQRIDVDAPHVAVHPDHRREARREVQIGRLVFDAECEQLGDVHGVPSVV